MQTIDRSHLVLIPSYNPGSKIILTVTEARSAWNPVWVVVDGSTDGSLEILEEMAEKDQGLKVIKLNHNQGKGAAVHEGIRLAHQSGYTHVLTMDSDGQHPSGSIGAFMALSKASPDSMILGWPVFEADAPSLRVKGRQISNWWANLETLWSGIGDSLFGFRVYPIAPLMEILNHQPFMRRFDFDPEAVVRLRWRGIRAINEPAPVRYFTAQEGGVTHFKYGRDNLLLTFMHTRLFIEFIVRLPLLILLRWRVS